MTTQTDATTIIIEPLSPQVLALSQLDGASCIAPKTRIISTPTTKSAATSVVKRVLDILLSLALIVILAPLLITIALMIRLESAGPALFKQRRGGLNGVSFRILKFRTMRVLEDGDDINQATRADQRVTYLGRILRKTSFDELPQLYNVLKGDMSLVGPRPHALAHDTYYAVSVDRYLDRLLVRPGLTGLAQVSGSRGETVGPNAMATRVSLDLAYIETWSIWLDLKLLVLTAVRVPFDRRAY